MQYIDLIAAKSNCNDKTKWLPYKVHALDTEFIMERLYEEWLPKSSRRYIAINLNASYDIEESEYIAKNFCRLIALVHDIGKITPAFQKKITPNIENHTEMLFDNGLKVSGITEYSKSPHNIAGQVILEELKFPKEISVIIGSHHGRAVQNYREQLTSYSANYFGQNNEQEQKWRGLWTEWIDYSLRKTGWSSVDKLPKPDVKTQMIITGLLIMSDWIASNTNYFPYIDIYSNISDEECNNRCKYAWDKLDFPNRWEAENAKDIIREYGLSEFFRTRFSYEPNHIQQAVMETVSENAQEGIYILEAPMGIGKTETALASAEILSAEFGAGGIYFGLPTQATANGIFGRIRDWAKGCDDKYHTIRLAHGMTELNEEYQEMFKGKAEDSGDECVIVHEWFEGRKQALLADFVIATIDQLLLASLKQRHVMLRHLGLSGKIVIIDECHAYDAYMNVYLDRTLTWLGAYKVPVIVLSATLPPQRRAELIKAYLNQNKNIIISNENSLAYPVLTWTCGNNVMQKAIESDTPNKHISVNEVDESMLITVLAEKLSDGGCAAVIVNTVDYAQKISKKISAEMSDFSVICFHSRFTAADRADIEKKLLKATGKDSSYEIRNKLIVVGTQVIEQSLDLDFDFMVTEICPMDLLLQRSGRLHRHERIRPDRLKNAELAILRPAESKSSMIYSEWILKRTENYLPKELIIPQCIPYLVSSVYNEPENDEEYGSAEYKEFKRGLSDKKTKAEKYCIKSNMLKSRFKNTLADFLDNDAGNNSSAEASVRDSDETIEVILMHKKSDTGYCLPSVTDSVVFDTTQVLSDTEARLIAMQRLKLPFYFSSKYNFNKTVKALDDMPKNWRESKWLDGELLLLVDDNSEVELIGKKLHYSKEFGLEMISE
ncbi:MAG: CRISPR-associated helicase Cas3' [Ruminococcus flavefaciens]|nr:CRISPR-associated helicase Cas3' [Ruminococcus flavefaciens]